MKTRAINLDGELIPPAILNGSIDSAERLLLDGIKSDDCETMEAAPDALRRRRFPCQGPVCECWTTGDDDEL